MVPMVYAECFGKNKKKMTVGCKVYSHKAEKYFEINCSISPLEFYNRVPQAGWVLASLTKLKAG